MICIVDPVISDIVTHAELQTCEIPQELQESVDRHRANLARLIASLQSAGIGDAQIEASVGAIMASYCQELLTAIKIMMRSPDDA
jgi:muramidase (phage lysozyme)